MEIDARGTRQAVGWGSLREAPSASRSFTHLTDYADGPDPVGNSVAAPSKAWTIRWLALPSP